MALECPYYEAIQLDDITLLAVRRARESNAQHPMRWLTTTWRCIKCSTTYPQTNVGASSSRHAAGRLIHMDEHGPAASARNGVEVRA